MASSNYYYLVASLPDIDFEEGFRRMGQSSDTAEKESPEASVDEIYESLKEGLSPADLEALSWLNYPVDHRNFISAYCGLDRPFLQGGSFSQEELAHLIEHPGEFPGHMQLFYDLYAQKSEAEALPANFLEDRLAGLFYEAVSRHRVEYLRRWFSFEFDLNNLLTAMQTRRFGMALEKRESPRSGQSWAASLVGESDANHAMLESRAYDFGLSGEFSWMSRVLNIEKAPAAILDRGIEKLRWDMAQEICRELTGEEIFSLEYILSYSICFHIIRRRLVLTSRRGEERLQLLSRTLVDQTAELIFQEAHTKNTKEAG